MATPLQLVIVGSGLDTRCLRLKLRDAHDAVGFSRIFELDFEGMHEEKGGSLPVGEPRNAAACREHRSRPIGSRRAAGWAKLTSEGSSVRRRCGARGVDELPHPDRAEVHPPVNRRPVRPESRLIATFLSATRPPGCIGEACKLGMHKFTTDDPIPVVAVFGPATCVTIGELAAFSPEAARLGVSAADASYTIVTATKR